jgi:hypothetical protein
VCVCVCVCVYMHTHTRILIVCRLTRFCTDHDVNHLALQFNSFCMASVLFVLGYEEVIFLL